MKAFIPSLTFLVAALCATSLLPNTAEAQSAVSNVHGVQKVTLNGGGKLNMVSSPFIQPAVLTSRVASISGAQITLEAALPLGVTLAGSYYVDIQSGAGNGRMTDIASVSSPTIVCVDDLSAVLAVGDSVSLRKIPTINDLLGADNKFGFKASADGDPSGVDLVYLLNAETKLFTKYFYLSYVDDHTLDGWYDEVSGDPSGAVKIYPESGMLVRVIGPSVSVPVLGEVKTNPTNVAVFSGMNLLAVLNPLSDVAAPTRLLTLGASGLYTGNEATGVKPSPTGDPDADNADILYLMDPVTNIFSSYFYCTHPDATGWLDTVSGDPADGKIIKSGTAFYLRRKSSTPFNWTQPSNHTNL